MTDREKVINDFEHEVKKAHGEGWDFVDLTTENGWKVLELLKEQEPQPVIFDRKCEAAPGWTGRKGFCPKCHQVVLWMVNREYCGFCGKAVKWDE